jgi:hypothetical protein
MSNKKDINLKLLEAQAEVLNLKRELNYRKMIDKWKAKVVPVGDEDYAVEFPPDMLETLQWETGDELKWNETDEGITLTKVDSTEVYDEALGFNSGKRVFAELDDEAFRVAEFIQELGKIQDQYFNTLWEKVKDKKWMRGFESDEEARDWLFDYCFNEKNDEGSIDKSFSEYCDAKWM